MGAAESTRSVLSGILCEAVRSGARPPTRCGTPHLGEPTHSPAGQRALIVEEVQKLRQRLAADPDAVRLDLPDLVDFMLGTGVRIGEACAVR